MQIMQGPDPVLLNFKTTLPVTVTTRNIATKRGTV